MGNGTFYLGAFVESLDLSSYGLAVENVSDCQGSEAVSFRLKVVSNVAIEAPLALIGKALESCAIWDSELLIMGFVTKFVCRGDEEFGDTLLEAINAFNGAGLLAVSAAAVGDDLEHGLVYQMSWSIKVPAAMLKTSYAQRLLREIVQENLVQYYREVFTMDGTVGSMHEEAYAGMSGEGGTSIGHTRH